ncbi:MAG: aminopeptidase [Bacillales bacterium]|jgi:aminopeptidase|nr:aminopeptidase [Bacillales bacterium]
MKDPRMNKLAKLLLNHSVKLQPKERVLIKAHHVAKPLALELIDEVYKMGAFPYFEMLDDDISKRLYMGYQKEQVETQFAWMLQQFKDVDCVIQIIGEENDSELAEIPSEKFKIRGDAYRPVQEFYINNRRWVLLNYPTRSLAQKAKMSTEKYEDFLLEVCSLDYKKMGQSMQPLVDLINKTDKVRIAGPGTDISFSIKGIGGVPCQGERNIPDGEVYSAPVRNSVNGQITYNTPCPYQGITHNNLCLKFENGKIVEATSDHSEKLQDVFNTDEGARYIGEFALGVNPLILHPMGDILFDEKIAGSLHFTPGSCYEKAYNGNKSAIHWDLVLIQREEYGGGEIWFDDVLIRKNGFFVIPELECLNPQNLL